MPSQKTSLLDEGEFSSIGSKKGSSGGGFKPETIKLVVAGVCLALAFGFLGYRYVYIPRAAAAAARVDNNPEETARMEEQFKEQEKEYERMLLNKEIEEGGA